jgi:hypothetical protein
LSKTVTVTDSIWVLPLSMSIARYHTTSLDEYQKLINDKHGYGLEQVNGHYYYYFPIGTALLVSPAVKLAGYLSKQVLYFDLNAGIGNGYGGGLELTLASMLVALASVFMYLAGIEITGSIWLALIAVFVFAFCGPAWSTASRALWSQTGSILMLSVALWAVLRARKNQIWLLVAALTLAYAYVARPTNSLSVIFISLAVIYTYRKKALGYVAVMLIVFIPFVLYNHHIYHQFLSPYYMPSRIAGNEHLAEGLMGNLFSPARGLFVFSPVLLFALAGIGIKLKQRTFNALDAALVLIILSHYYVISSISALYGGWCFGPRLFTEIIPFFIYFLIYFFQWLAEQRKGIFKTFLIASTLLTIAVSFFINFRGATRPSTFMWNATPDIDQHPERIWDWHDLQFMR